MANFLTTYTEKSLAFENSLSSDYKKDLGVFYTDIGLSKKIVDYLRIPDSAVLMDPCCGTGSFLVAAMSRGCGHIFGADIDKKAIKLCKEITGTGTIKALDTLADSGAATLKKMKLGERVDYVIGNPPYAPIEKAVNINSRDPLFLRTVRASGNNLFVAALYRAFELAKPQGYISYIIPKNFLHVASYRLLRQMLLRELRIVSIFDLGAYFKGVRGEQIVLTLQNQYAEGNEIHFFSYAAGRMLPASVIPQSFCTDEILVCENQMDYQIFSKLERSYRKLADICHGYVGRGKSTAPDAVSGKDIRKFGFKERAVPKTGNRVFIQNIYSAESGIIASFAGGLQAAQTVTVITDGDEKMCRYLVGVLHSRLCNYYLVKFCYNSSKLTMHTDAKYLRKIPLQISRETFPQIVGLVEALEQIRYRSGKWFKMLESLNELVYRTYGLTRQEIDHIDTAMRSIQSKRWLNDQCG